MRIHVVSGYWNGLDCAGLDWWNEDSSTPLHLKRNNVSYFTFPTVYIIPQSVAFFYPEFAIQFFRIPCRDGMM